MAIRDGILFWTETRPGGLCGPWAPKEKWPGRPGMVRMAQMAAWTGSRASGMAPRKATGMVFGAGPDALADGLWDGSGWALGWALGRADELWDGLWDGRTSSGTGGRALGRADELRTSSGMGSGTGGRALGWVWMGCGMGPDGVWDGRTGSGMGPDARTSSGRVRINFLYERRGRNFLSQGSGRHPTMLLRTVSDSGLADWVTTDTVTHMIQE
ncbi:hypothetical protein Bbelb_319020 [Branchiostoma belcheri]|nr:hypothetical protein Bbelb_319020 [Branchiostoma belcheri]